MSLEFWGVMGYIALTLVVGFWASRGVETEDDYLLAGRKIGPMLAIFTTFATWFGAETCIGSAGSIYSDGLGGSTADPFGYALCLVLMGAIFAVPLWRLHITTLADLFRMRFGLSVERLVTLLVVPTSLMWGAAQIRAFGQVLTTTSDMGLFWGTTIAAAVVIAYTVSGGLMADVVTDFVQGIALIVGLVILGGVVVYQFDGSVIDHLRQLPSERLALFGTAETPFFERIEMWAIPIFGSVLSQELVARVMAVRTPQIARTSTLIASGMYLLVGLIPVGIGLLGPALLPNLEHAEQLLPAVARQSLPTILYVVFAGALVSAILSTVDSALLVAASLTEHNLIVSFWPNLPDKSRVRIARTLVVIFGVLAYTMALYAEGVYALVEEASAFGSSGVFVVATLGLFTRYGGIRAAWASLVSGILVYLAGAYIFAFGAPYLLSLGAALLAYLLVGLTEGRFAGFAHRPSAA